jgi:hypothetical protein
MKVDQDLFSKPCFYDDTRTYPIVCLDYFSNQCPMSNGRVHAMIVIKTIEMFIKIVFLGQVGKRGEVNVIAETRSVAHMIATRSIPTSAVR